jgi:two-component sensor histidine kinase
MESRQAVKFSTTLKDTAGRDRNFEGTYVPKVNDDGGIEGIVGYFGDVTERIQSGQRLELALKEKELLLAELHHRVKNNLTMVQSLLGLELANVADEHSRKIFVDTQARIQAMALLYQYLATSGDHQFARAKEYFTNLVRGFMDSYSGSGIRFETQFDDIDLDVRRAVPLGLILNEAVMNCVKHAFPSVTAGTVRVTIQKVDHRITVEVRDNGVGLPQGFDIEHTQSMGTKLIRTLAKQIHGTLAISNENGTRVSVSFPV